MLPNLSNLTERVCSYDACVATGMDASSAGGPSRKSSRMESADGAGPSSELNDPDAPQQVPEGLLNSGKLDDAIEMTVRNKIANEFQYDPSEVCKWLKNVTDSDTESEDKGWQAFYKHTRQNLEAGAFTEFVWREAFALCFDFPDILYPEVYHHYKLPREYFSMSMDKASVEMGIDAATMRFLHQTDKMIPNTWRGAFSHVCEVIEYWNSRAPTMTHPEKMTQAWAQNRNWNQEMLDWALYYIQRLNPPAGMQITLGKITVVWILLLRGARLVRFNDNIRRGSDVMRHIRQSQFEQARSLLEEHGKNVYLGSYPNFRINEPHRAPPEIVFQLVQSYFSIQSTIDDHLKKDEELAVRYKLDRWTTTVPHDNMQLNLLEDQKHRIMTLLQVLKTFGSASFDQPSYYVPDTNIVPPIVFAAQKVLPKMVRALLDFDADVNVIDRQGNTPLTTVAEQRRQRSVHADDIKLIFMMLLQPESKADVDFPGLLGGTALWVASSYEEAVYKDYEDARKFMVNGLIRANADVDKANMNGLTPLHMACRGGSTDTARVLLQNNANPNVVDSAGITPLYNAVSRSPQQWGDLLRALLANSADINHVNSRDETALYVACKNQNRVAVTRLLAHHADVNIKAKNGLTPLALAIQNGWETMVDLLSSDVPME